MKSLGPCFQFYHDDYLGGTNHFSDRQHGAYLLLLIEQWRTGYLHDDSTELRAVARTTFRGDDKRWLQVLAKFPVCEDGLRRNARMDAIRCERLAFIEKQSAAGRKSAEKRAATTVQPAFNGGSTKGVTKGQPEGNPPSPSPTPTPEDSIPTPYGRLCACLPEAMKPPTIETVAAWARAYGITLADHEDIIAADLRSTPPNLWAKDGLLRVKYAIANAADRHQRMGSAPRISQREQDMQAASRAAAESGI